MHRDVIFLDIALEAAIRGVIEASLSATKAATQAGTRLTQKSLQQIAVLLSCWVARHFSCPDLSEGRGAATLPIAVPAIEFQPSSRGCE